MDSVGQVTLEKQLVIVTCYFFKKKKVAQPHMSYCINTNDLKSDKKKVTTTNMFHESLT